MRRSKLKKLLFSNIYDPDVYTEDQQKIIRKLESVTLLVRTMIKVESMYIVRSWEQPGPASTPVSYMEFLMDFERRTSRRRLSMLVVVSTNDIRTPSDQIALKQIQVIAKDCFKDEVKKAPLLG